MPHLFLPKPGVLLLYYYSDFVIVILKIRIIIVILKIGAQIMFCKPQSLIYFTHILDFKDAKEKGVPAGKLF